MEAADSEKLAPLSLQPGPFRQSGFPLASATKGSLHLSYHSGEYGRRMP